MARTSLAELIAQLTVQKQNLPTYQTEVDATAADITAVTQELADLDYIVGYADVIDASKKTVFQIKQAMYDGDENEPVADFPVFPVAAAPFPPVGGCLTRANDRARRFKAAPGYTHEIGVALGIAGDGSEKPDPGTVKPTLEAHAAQTDFLYSVVIGNRAESNSWEIEYRIKGGEWTSGGTFTGKSADVTFPSSNDEPVVIDLRIQLKKNNANYGQLSDTVTITVNP